MFKKFISLSAIIICIIFFSCQSKSEVSSMIEKKSFGKLSDGREADLYTLKNEAGCKVEITNYGATVVSLFVPDRSGKFQDVVLGYDSVQAYADGSSYFGAIVGRYGNRIGIGKFELDGKTYQLTINDGRNQLHGGVVGFNKVMWTAEPIESPTDPALKLTYVSKDGEEGYPGTVNITVTYTLTKNNELKIDYEATTDKPTILNPTHHSYFNLSGDFNQTILDNLLSIDADKFTPVDQFLIPTGELLDVKGTPMDFKTPAAIGLRINDDYQQLKFGKGYDHNWALNNYDGTVKNVATVYEPTSGRYMTVATDQPGLQFYSGNFLDGTAKGKNGIMYKHRTGLCLEAQKFPDSPNKPNFVSPVLRPGEVYKQTTIYKFSTK